MFQTYHPLPPQKRLITPLIEIILLDQLQQILKAWTSLCPSCEIRLKLKHDFLSKKQLTLDYDLLYLLGGGGGFGTKPYEIKFSKN